MFSAGTFVVTHHHLRLHLTHRVERDADDDQHGCAAERAPVACEKPKYLMKMLVRSRSSRGTVSPERQPLQHAVEVRRGRGPGGCRDEPPDLRRLSPGRPG